MPRYHVNLETGEPGICKAEIKCPFGEEKLHFDSSADARKSYELSQKGIPGFLHKEIISGKTNREILAARYPGDMVDYIFKGDEDITLENAFEAAHWLETDYANQLSYQEDMERLYQEEYDKLNPNY